MQTTIAFPSSCSRRASKCSITSSAICRTPVVCPDHGFKLGPLGLEGLLFFQLLPFGQFLELGIDVGFFLFVQRQLGEPALVVDGDSCPVLFGASDVIDADVVSKDGTGIGVVQFDGRPGESQEGCFGAGRPSCAGRTRR